MSRYIDADALEYDTEWSEYHDGFTAYSQMAIDTAPSIDIVRCKECASYCGDGNKCLWGLLTVDMGYCHHGYRGGDCITKQTEPQTCQECEHWNDTEDGCADRHGCKTEPQTDCSWK